MSEPERDICRICHEEDDPEKMICPCWCSGGHQYIHRACLDRWRMSDPSRSRFHSCSDCGMRFVTESEFAAAAAAAGLGGSDSSAAAAKAALSPAEREEEERKVREYWYASVVDSGMTIALVITLILLVSFLFAIFELRFRCIDSILPLTMLKGIAYYIAVMVIVLSVGVVLIFTFMTGVLWVPICGSPRYLMILIRESLANPLILGCMAITGFVIGIHYLYKHLSSIIVGHRNRIWMTNEIDKTRVKDFRLERERLPPRP